MPIDFGAGGTLAGALGDQLKAVLAGDALAGDVLYVLNTNGVWLTIDLDASKTWNTNGAPVDEEISPALSFWIKRRASAGSVSTNAVYTGPVHTNAMPFTFRANAWHMIAWPFARPKAESAPVAGWGFAAAGAQRGASFLTGDNLISDTHFLWLHTDGRWRNADGSPAATVKLEAGEGYYYYHCGSGFTWTAEE
jgi:hypothetical protein